MARLISEERLTQLYETICACHQDDWHTDYFKMEHEASHYKKLFTEKNQQYDRLFRLIQYYNGDPLLMTIRDKDIRRRHRWCTQTERQFEEKDARSLQREIDVSRREAAVFQRELRMDGR